MEKLKNIVLGDQFPTGGGLKRRDATLAAGHGGTYFLQDVDTPWCEDASKNHVQIVQGTPKYWSFGARVPYALSGENASVALDAMRQSLGGPKAYVYLTGPKTSDTIRLWIDNPDLGGQVKKLFSIELDWVIKLATWLDDPDAIKRAEYVKEVVERLNGAGPLSAIAGLAAAIHPGVEISSCVEMFRTSPPLLLNDLPPSYFWIIDASGRRRTYSAPGSRPVSEDEIVVPKGKVLPLEMAARNLVLGFTGLAYLPEVIEIRDKFVPGLKLKLLQIQFDWVLEQNPLETAWDEFKVKKSARGQVVEKPVEELDEIRKRAQARPTSISHYVLGGEVRSKLTYSEV